MEHSEGQDSSDELEVVEVLRVDRRVRVDLESVVVVLSTSIERVSQCCAMRSIAREVAGDAPLSTRRGSRKG